MAEQTIHPFERAGLGLAPFRFVGMEHRVGPLLLADGTQVGAPGQPMGSCAFCGQGIAYCCQIESADGKRFIVGCDCVRKVSEKKERVLTDVERAIRDTKRNEKWAKDLTRINAARERLAANPTLLTDRPHPQPWRAERGETLRDSIEWYLSNAGMTGRLWAAREIELAVG